MIGIGNRLLTKRNVPVVAAKEAIIREVASSEFWSNASLSSIDHVRKEIRDLIHLLREENIINPIYTDLDDILIESEVAEFDIIRTIPTHQAYRDRVEAFIRKNKNHLVIDKLYRNLPINSFELNQLEEYLIEETLDSKEKFVQEYGEQPLGSFIRRIIGLDQESINQHFAAFINEGNLSAKQIKFLDTVIRYFVKNGFLETFNLTEPPFTSIDDSGIIGIFDDNDTTKLINLIREVNNNADIGA
ncbi:type I restriction-modification enzyme R subunit C-terminal domain-containing protein [Albibacterium profundi]|uniref:Type I restriction-modification enzyme R subunit C-terminal domain-containing protein n=1 Tax=Albibacterium profundi TaxID=3134906 RepID=A0ABV5CG38_9SPHI